MPLLTNEEKKIICIATKIVSKYFSISIDDIYSKRKTRVIAKARGILLFYMNKKKGISASKLSQEYNLSIRAVRWHIANVRNFINIYNDYKKEFEDIICILNENI